MKYVRTDISLRCTQQRYHGMKLVVGRDKMDEVQGVKQKVQAFERFLEVYGSKDPELKEKACFTAFSFLRTITLTETIPSI